LSTKIRPHFFFSNHRQKPSFSQLASPNVFALKNLSLLMLYAKITNRRVYHLSQVLQRFWLLGNQDLEFENGHSFDCCKLKYFNRNLRFHSGWIWLFQNFSNIHLWETLISGLEISRWVLVFWWNWKFSRAPKALNWSSQDPLKLLSKEGSAWAKTWRDFFRQKLFIPVLQAAISSRKRDCIVRFEASSRWSSDEISVGFFFGFPRLMT